MTEFRPIKFVREELPIPTQNRIGLGHCRHVLQSPSTQAVSDLCQCRPLSFRKQQPTLDLTSFLAGEKSRYHSLMGC
jgi:hypothetical protein